MGIADLYRRPSCTWRERSRSPPSGTVLIFVPARQRVAQQVRISRPRFGVWGALVFTRLGFKCGFARRLPAWFGVAPASFHSRQASLDSLLTEMLDYINWHSVSRADVVPQKVTVEGELSCSGAVRDAIRGLPGESLYSFR